MKPASLILAAVASPLVLATAQPTQSNASAPSMVVPSNTSHEGITIAGECSWYGGINGWYYNSWSSGPYACYGAIGERWTMRRAYRSGGTENVHWKYTNDPNDPACMNDWVYYAEDGTTLIAEIRGRTTLIADPRYWCALPVYRSGGVEDRQWKYCLC